jgi:hypothetical protein
MPSSDSDDDAPRGANSAGAKAAAPDGLDPASLPALFWDEMPERPEDHPDYAGLQALADECTPEERAETFKARPAGRRGRGVGRRWRRVVPCGRVPDAHRPSRTRTRARAHTVTRTLTPTSTHTHTFPKKNGTHASHNHARPRRPRPTRSWRSA